ncbi:MULTISPECIES: hypothetical protein [Rossellomorea]|uniref:MFS transporter n=1 Tax=Rossellomorea vietnamensis TaxID=218284 RepID=A0A6I6UWR7_9BACI|nr:MULTISPECIES: hypothetical protein [Rossellomorea]QHE63300.1 hypothetical protein FHE72_21655 [Rossellomorea vietnamensis]WGG45357.1 hypothetical protein P8596_22065 [Rossellomorea sp. DA94]
MSALGLLVSKLGLSESVAFGVVAALTTGGASLVAALYPFLAPFVLTLRGILAIAGTGAVIGY